MGAGWIRWQVEVAPEAEEVAAEGLRALGAAGTEHQESPDGAVRVVAYFPAERAPSPEHDFAHLQERLAASGLQPGRPGFTKRPSMMRIGPSAGKSTFPRCRSAGSGSAPAGKPGSLPRHPDPRPRPRPGLRHRDPSHDPPLPEGLAAVLGFWRCGGRCGDRLRDPGHGRCPPGSPAGGGRRRGPHRRPGGPGERGAQPAPVGGDGTGGEYRGGRAGRPGGPARGSPAGGGQSAHLDPGRAGPHLGPDPGSRGRAPRLRRSPRAKRERWRPPSGRWGWRWPGGSWRRRGCWWSRGAQEASERALPRPSR